MSNHALIKKTVDGSDVVKIKFDATTNTYSGQIQYRDRLTGKFQVENLIWTVSGKTRNPNKNLVLP